MKHLEKNSVMGKRNGFALILAIAAMAFMVLLTLTLSSIITSKLRLLNAQKEMRSARSNAILGMSIAISQLQSKLGKDNAISIPSTLLDMDPETIEIDEVKVPYLVGSIDVNINASSMGVREWQDEHRDIFKTLKNGGSSEDVSWFISSKKPIGNPQVEDMADLNDETVVLAKYKTLARAPGIFGGSITQSDKNTEVNVQAGKIKFSTGTASSAQDGAYAWWVSDESMKAKINLTRPERYLGNEMGSAEKAEAPADSRVPQITNLFFVEQLANYNLNPFLDQFDAESSALIAKMSSLDEFSIIDPLLGSWAKDNKNDWTATSIGIPVDVTQARLKEDLTAYMEGEHGLEDRDIIVRGNPRDRNYTGPSYKSPETSISNYNENLPRFGIMHDYAHVARDAKGISNAGVDPQHASFGSASSPEPSLDLAPVILRTRTFFMPLIDPNANLYDYEAPVKMSLAVQSRIWIWNPHNVKLNAANYIIRLNAPYNLRFYDHKGKDLDEYEANGDKSGNNLGSNLPVAYTNWRILRQKTDGTWYKTIGEESQEDTKDEFRIYYTANISDYRNSFLYFLQSRSDSGQPMLNYKVEDLEILPGQVVELVQEGGTNGKRIKQFDSSANPLNTTNILVPGSISSVVAESSGNILPVPDRWLRINLGQNGQDLELTPNVALDENMKDYVLSGTRDDLSAGNEVKKVLFLDAKKQSTADSATPENVAFIPVSAWKKYNPVWWDKTITKPYLQTWWGIDSNADKNKKRAGTKYGNDTAYPRFGYEIILETKDGWKRARSLDINEWDGNTVANQDRYEIHRYHRNNNMLGPAEGHDRYANPMQMNNAKDDNEDGEISEAETSKYFRFASAVLMQEDYFQESTNMHQDVDSGKLPFFVAGQLIKSWGGGSENLMMAHKAADTFGTGNSAGSVKDFAFPHRRVSYGFRQPPFTKGEMALLTGINLRASNVQTGTFRGIPSNDMSDLIKRPYSSKSRMANHGVSTIFTHGQGQFDGFMAITSGYRNTMAGAFSWKYGEKASGFETQMDDLMGEYNTPGHYGIASQLSDDGRYSMDYLINAPFDYPRTAHDIMSISNFRDASLSPLEWQPTYAVGESYATPFMDRENVVEKGVGQLANELVDISYVLNHSLWDRFYISTLIPSDMPNEVKAGMRLPNTRYFLKNVPKDKSELYGSDDAFEKSAAYVGIDGVFNVNSTSYEAWRAVLGGMLGTKKKALNNKLINEEIKSFSDADDFLMPNPGDLNPLATPTTRGTSTQDIYFKYKDLFIGRQISEAEIDQLAREIVAEVKRRAPFFSLADFVNRRLVPYESGTDKESIDKKYQGLMGTLAAAIHRSTQDDRATSDISRPKHFFNSVDMDPDKNKISNNKDAETNNFVRYGNTVTAHDNEDAGRSSNRDFGEKVKANKPQYIEQAFCAPIVSNKIWNSKLTLTKGMLKQSDILSMLGPIISVRGDTFTIRAYGESKNPMTGTTSKAYCEAVVQRSAEPVEPADDIVAPESPFGRRFNVVSFRWLTPAEL